MKQIEEMLMGVATHWDNQTAAFEEVLRILETQGEVVSFETEAVRNVAENILSQIRTDRECLSMLGSEYVSADEVQVVLSETLSKAEATVDLMAGFIDSIGAKEQFLEYCKEPIGNGSQLVEHCKELFVRCSE